LLAAAGVIGATSEPASAACFASETEQRLPSITLDSHLHAIPKPGDAARLIAGIAFQAPWSHFDGHAACVKKDAAHEFLKLWEQC
jgi:hypothetical protein